jgi:pimeloyl-ACP methyl ester carboxylesterase
MLVASARRSREHAWFGMTEIRVDAPDGRALQVWVEGPEDGDVVIDHHGTPSSGLPFPPSVAATTERGLRYVAYSRPGYGASTREEGRSVASCTADVAAIADALGVDRFYTLGGSGGGPHTLACGALLSERVIAVASIAGVVPWGAEGIDFLEGMGEDNHVEFGAAVAGPIALTAWMDAHAHDMAQASSVDELLQALGDLVSPVDAASLTGELGAHMIANEHVALANGYWGWYDDDLAFTRDWGFDPGAIAVPVAIWQGRQDRFVPFTHGEWLAAHVPGARAHIYHEHGHLSLALASFGAILDDLIDLGTGRAG